MKTINQKKLIIALLLFFTLVLMLTSCHSTSAEKKRNTVVEKCEILNIEKYPIRGADTREITVLRVKRLSDNMVFAKERISHQYYKVGDIILLPFDLRYDYPYNHNSSNQ